MRNDLSEFLRRFLHASDGFSSRLAVRDPTRWRPSLGPEALPSLLFSSGDDLHAVLRLSRLPPSPWVHIREELFEGSSVLPESVLAVCGRGAVGVPDASGIIE